MAGRKWSMYSEKPMSKRKAVASGKIQLQRETIELIAKDQITKATSSRLRGSLVFKPRNRPRS